jgi:hypothetical protein
MVGLSVHNGRMIDGGGAGTMETGWVEGGPVEEYRRRLLVLEGREAGLKAQAFWLGYLRLATVVAFVAVSWFTVFLKEGPRWLVLVPFVLFVGLGVWMGRASRRLSLARRAAEMVRVGMARVEDRWAGAVVARDVLTGRPAGLVEKLKASLYADDLDIVGRGGLFELLCVARTRMGEEMLLTWLLEPAAVSEVLERQAAVEELRARLEFRERMGVAGESATVGVQAEALLEWAGAEDVLTQRWMPWVAGVLGVSVAVLAVLWLRAELLGASAVSVRLLLAMVGVVAVEAAVRRPFEKRMEAVLGGTEQALKNLQLLAALLREMEVEGFASARLVEIKRKLGSHEVAGSVAIGGLARLDAWRESMDNMMVRWMNLPLMYSVQVAWAVQRWRRRHGGAVRLWVEAVAEMEALLSLATFAYEHPADVFPEFAEGAAFVEAEEMGHPLIAAAKCVRNSVRMGAETRVLLISGSNMSGKSTLMRTVGVNTVLAMCGAPVRAKSLRLTPLRIGASLLVNDSLQEGHSRFYAEIEKLRRICLLAESGGAGVMFLLDELLQGTNSKDRLAGAQGVVRALVQAGAMGIVTTHDLALAEMDGLQPGAMRNMHFQDEIVDGEMRFDFTLREGAAMKSNGVELMRLIGLKV